jgi:hypothetical protein
LIPIAHPDFRAAVLAVKVGLPDGVRYGEKSEVGDLDVATELRHISLEEFAVNAEELFRDVVRDRASIVIHDEHGDRVVMAPVGPRPVWDPEEIKRPRTSEEVARALEGINRAAGSWKGLIDAEEFKSYIRERRRTKNRPQVRF